MVTTWLFQQSPGMTKLIMSEKMIWLDLFPYRLIAPLSVKLTPRIKTIVIGKDAKDVSKEDSLDYVAGYTVGNDISSRKLQRDPIFAGRVPQWGFSKGVDTYAPMDPCLLASSLVEDPKRLRLTTKVDGEVRQDGLGANMLFDCVISSHTCRMARLCRRVV